MAQQMMSWQELLSFEQFDDYTDEYGPHTQAVVNCFETLETISWFAAVGAETEMDVEGVDTWGEALAPIMDKSTAKYTPEGHLVQPSEAVEQLEGQKKLQKHLERAFDDVGSHVDFLGYVPGYFDKPQKAFMKAHIETWLRNLLVEIIADADSTYFRELLPWYEAGHFPCGWEGDWPDGRPRIF